MQEAKGGITRWREGNLDQKTTAEFGDLDLFVPQQHRFGGSVRGRPRRGPQSKDALQGAPL